MVLLPLLFQVSMLIYSITDLRSLAKNPKKKNRLKTPEKILNLPLSLSTCLEMLEENYDVVKEEFGDDEHANTMSSLQAIHARYHNHEASDNNNSNMSTSFVGQWFNPFARADGSVEVEKPVPVLTLYGDENPESDMVYAVGIDPIRKRITVAFRGSVTPTDFMKDAMIAMKHQPNPVKKVTSHDLDDTIGIHQGFYDYLLKPRKPMNKFDTILGHISSLFVEVPERQKDYKVYVTGHSLGGALSTLFSLYLAAFIGDKNTNTVIPGPISCISIASPRVGDLSFQKAFGCFEELGLLRHLRVANDRDPVTMMPGATGKKIWAALSPVSYLAFKLMDNQFEEKESFRHTGVKLRLSNEEYDFFYLGTHVNLDGNDDVEAEETNDETSLGQEGKNTNNNNNKRASIRTDKIPDVMYHLGNAYTENVTSVKPALSTLYLNDLYKTQVASIFEAKKKENEQKQEKR